MRSDTTAPPAPAPSVDQAPAAPRLSGRRPAVGYAGCN